MDETGFSHRLAAILVADAAGYSRLMADDESATVEALDAARAVFRSQTETHHGRVVDTAGDSVLAVFETASGAVTAAVAIQKVVNATAKATSEGRRMQFRIGLHLGDVIEKVDGTAYGDGVNIAARLQGLAEPGGVTVSESIRSVVKGKVTAGFEDQGEQSVKNIADPVRAWRLRADGVESGRLNDPPPPIRAPASNLPARPTRLIGRTDEVAQARKLLALHRMVTVTAVGGSGKTRLAIAIGEEELPQRRDGVWFADLTAVMNGEDVPAAIASALRLVLTSGDPGQQVIAYLADKSALVILDNCEHVIDACARFADAFLAVAGRTVVLATSREALGVDGEQVTQLASLSAKSVGASESPAVQLFVERASSIDPSFRLDAGNEATIKTLCERLDGMPLAIELAAARATVMTPAELLGGLDDRFALLSNGHRRQRHRTLETTLDWSYELLDPELQRVFRTLGVFVGGFDVDAVAAVADLSRTGALNALQTLIAKSLVMRTESLKGTRFGLLETLKSYAENLLVRANESAGVRELHLEHFHHLAMIHGRVVDADVRLGERMRYDRSNITTAFEWAAAHHRWVLAAELLLGARTVYDNFGHAAEAESLFHRCEAPVEVVDPELAEFLRASMLNPLALLDEWFTVVDICKRLRASANAHVRTLGCAVLAHAYAVSNPTRSREMRDMAVQTFATVHQPGVNTDIVHTDLMFVVGSCLEWEGDAAGALAAFDQASDIASRHDHVLFSSLMAHSEAAMCLLLLGEPKKALARVARLEGLAYALGGNQIFVALARLELGDVEAARKLIHDHAVEAATGRLSNKCSEALVMLAKLAHAEGDDATATALLSKFGVGRLPSTTQYARYLARRLGVGDQLAQNEQKVYTPQSVAEHGVLGIRRAMTALRVELTRRGWD